MTLRRSSCPEFHKTAQANFDNLLGKSMLTPKSNETSMGSERVSCGVQPKLGGLMSQLQSKDGFWWPSCYEKQQIDAKIIISVNSV